MNLRLTGAVLAVPVLVACAGPSGIGGQTTAKGALRADTLSLIETFARARLACERLDSVRAEVMVDADRRVAGRPAGSVQEYWSVTGCDRRAVFEVTFVPDGNGARSTEVALVGRVRDASCQKPKAIGSAPESGGSLAERMASAGRRCR